MNRHYYPNNDLDDLRRALRDNAAVVVRALLGPENKKHSTKTQLRYGRNKASLSVEIGPKNTGTWFDWSDNVGGDMFNLIRRVHGCGFAEAKAIARALTGLPAPATAASYQPRSRIIRPGQITEPQHNEATQKFGAGLWKQSIDPRGTRVETYLKSRGLTISDEIAGSVLRYHRPFNYAGRTAGAMVCLFRNITSNEPCAVSVTFLDKDARKFDRRFFGPTTHAAIKFYSNPTNELSVGEGVESTLSGAVMGYEPAWAVGSAGAIAKFPVVEGIKTPRIFGELDNANALAVKALAQRWRNSGADIFVINPRIGNDLNDALREERGL